MSKFRVAKGALYLLFAIVSPLLLERHPVMAVIQTVMFGMLGGALIYKGLCHSNPGAGSE